MASHTYYYTPSRWLIYLSMGAFGVAIPFITLVVNYPKLVSAQLDTGSVVGLVVVFVLLLPFGLLMLSVPFLARITISPQGLEYQTLSAIIRFDWREAASLKGIEARYVGKSLVLISQYADISPRPWTRLLPWDVRRNLIGMPIPVSSFGGFHGRRLLVDIRQYAPDLLEPQGS